MRLLPFGKPANAEAQKREGAPRRVGDGGMRPYVPALHPGSGKAETQAGPQGSVLLQSWGWQLGHGLAVPGGCGLVGHPETICGFGAEPAVCSNPLAFAP